MRSFVVVAAFAFCMAVFTTEAFGQGFGSGSTGTGAFGDRSFGSGVSGRTGGGTPGSQVEQFQADAGTVTGSERFIQANRDPASFVGADRGELAGTGNRQPGANAGALQSLQALFGGGGLRPQQDPNLGAANGNQGRRTLRVQLRIGFAIRAVEPSVMVGQFENRLNRIPQIRGGEPIRAAMVDRTIVLQGTVDSDYARDLAERIARLEPGVSQVQNDLTVVASSNR